MKFALFLVCALVAVQGFQARSVERSDDGLGESIDAIMDLIKKIEHIVHEDTSEILGAIHNINDKMSEFAVTFQEFIADFGKKTEDLTDLAGEAGGKCLESHQDRIVDLLEFYQNIYQGCVDEVDSYTLVLKTHINVVDTKTKALSAEVNERISKCLNAPMQKPITLAKCLSELIESTKDQIVDLEKVVLNTIAFAKETAEEAVSALDVCTAKVNEEVAEKEADLLDSIRQCVATSI